MKKIKLKFEDEDPNIRLAREIARQYLHDAIKLANPGLNGETSAPRNLLDTLRVTLEIHPDDPAMRQAMNMRAPEGNDILPQEYDPDREDSEARETTRRSRGEKNKQKLNDIVTAMELLADWSVAELDTRYVQKHIAPLLREAPTFIMKKVTPTVIQEEHRAHRNLAHAEKIARRIKSKLYPTLPPESAEITHDDHHHTKMILRYVDKRSKVAELAFNNFLTAIQKVNAALDGHGRARN